MNKEIVYKPGEILFNPKLIPFDNAKSLPEMLSTSLDRCNEDLRNELIKNMVFCGGSSLIYGLK